MGLVFWDLDSGWCGFPELSDIECLLGLVFNGVCGVAVLASFGGLGSEFNKLYVLVLGFGLRGNRELERCS